MARRKQTSPARAKLPPEYDYLTAEERARLAALANPRAVPPLTFRQFVSIVRPHFIWYTYAVRLAAVLQLVADGFYKRVMIFAPPRLGKSEIVSRLFSAYFIYRFGARWVALSSYAAELAYTLSRASRANYMDAVGKNSTGGDTEAVKHWETGKGGGLWAAGVRGPATGKGADLFIIDDPVKDATEAASETIQDRNLEWNDAVVDTRLEKNAARIVIQTRWHQKDLAGLLLSRESGDAPEGWHIVCFEAIKEPNGTYQWPKTCTVEPDWRKVGESVCPERLPLERLDTIRRRNPYVWSALYQQRPTPKEGGTFKRSWFEIVPGPPPKEDILVIGRWWDLAATEGGGTFTVGVKMARTKRGRYYILDVVRGQWGAGTRDARVRQVAEMDGKSVRQYGPQDPGQAGKTAAAAFRQLLDGFPVTTIIESGDKETRADPLASAAYTEDAVSGRVKLVRAEWNEPFLAELAAFPYGNDNDQVDAASNIYSALSLWKPPVVKASGTRTVWTG